MVNQSSSYGGFIVNPGDRGSSSLYQKLVGNGSYGSRMPQGGQLEQSYIDIIGQWIDSGAPKEFAGSVQSASNGQAVAAGAPAGAACQSGSPQKST